MSDNPPNDASLKRWIHFGSPVRFCQYRECGIRLWPKIGGIDRKADDETHKDFLRRMYCDNSHRTLEALCVKREQEAMPKPITFGKGEPAYNWGGNTKKKKAKIREIPDEVYEAWWAEHQPILAASGR